MVGGTAEEHDGDEQGTAAHFCTEESSPAVSGCSRVSPGEIHLALPLTQDVEVQASLVRASGAGCHAEVRARILDLNRVDLQGAVGQELQPGKGQQGSPVGALHGQDATHRDTWPRRWPVPSQPDVAHIR